MAAPLPSPHPHGTLSENVMAFCRLLRDEHGFTIGPGETADALRAIEHGFTTGAGETDNAPRALDQFAKSNPSRALKQLGETANPLHALGQLGETDPSCAMEHLGETAGPLRALDQPGLAEPARTRAALSLVLCASREQAERFDPIFDAFFLPAPRRGVPQRNLRPRHTRPSPPLPLPLPAMPAPDRPPGRHERDGEAASESTRRLPVAEARGDVRAWQSMRARFSAEAGQGEPPQAPREGLDAMLAAAGMLVRRLRLGRSRRWRPMPLGPRYDFRRTVRASLQTGGEAMKPRWQGHPRRNPRIVVIVDGSRSMSESAGRMLQFAYALSRRTTRLRAFVFSTELRDVTMQLRRTRWDDVPRLVGVAEAWGGGTRIGACLEQLIHEHGAACLSEHTAVFILSDGLDVGEPERLRHAMRELRRRAAGVIWLNPLLGAPGYTPSSLGMAAALPYIDVFSAAHDVDAFGAMARTLRL